jgi:uncharacterized membrane protein YkoI
LRTERAAPAHTGCAQAEGHRRQAATLRNRIASATHFRGRGSYAGTAARQVASRHKAAYAQVKRTLAEAIATAESQTGGSAVEAKLEQEHGTLAFEVEILKDGAFQKLVLDAKTGQVLKSNLADRGDDEEDGEQNDD